MIKTKHFAAGLCTAAAMALAVPAVQADDISSVEGARAKDRQGAYLTRQEREKLRRHGGNDDWGYSGGYSTGYYDGPGVSVYVGPGPGPYYDPYYGY